jgi:thioesterase domain-containing protein
MPPATVDTAIMRALDAYDRLTELAEEFEDEWTYVNDLAEAWRDRLGAVAAARAGSTLDPAADAAIDRAIDEIGRISDPHRAIDWLSTFPQVALLALDEPT